MENNGYFNEMHVLPYMILQILDTYLFNQPPKKKGGKEKWVESLKIQKGKGILRGKRIF